MKNGLMLSSIIAFSLLASNACFADIVHFNNGFTYEGEVSQDAPTGGYWIDGALVSKSEIKSIEEKELNVAQSVAKGKKQSWLEGFLASTPFFNKNKKARLDVAAKDSAPNADRVSSYSKPIQASSSQSRTNYSGTSRSVWQSIRRNTSTGAASGKYNSAGYITKKDRNNDLQALRRNSAAYDLRAERQKNKSTLSLSKQNSAGYELSRQRALIDRELSSFGGSNTKY